MALKVLLIINLFAVLHSQSFACDCPLYWTPWRNYCYRYFGASVSWNSAKHQCRQFGSGVDLVSIHSQEEQNFVYNYWKPLRESIAPYPAPGMWIGLNDIEEHGHHEWSDGTPVNYEYYEGNQEYEDGDIYFLWDVVTSTQNPRGKWHNIYHRPDWYFQYMCKMSQATALMLQEAEEEESLVKGE